MVQLLCPLTKEVITDKVVAADGFTYERNVLVKYIRKHNKSPVTGEPLSLDSLVFDEDYTNSSMNIADQILDNINTELQQCISLKKQFANFECVPDEIKICLKKVSDHTWKCFVEATTDVEISERQVKTIHHNCCTMYFQATHSTCVYMTKHRGNGNLEVHGKDAHTLSN